MTRWGEIKCPRCEEWEAKLAQQDDLVQTAVAAVLMEVDKAIQAVADNCTTEDGHLAIVAAVEKVRSFMPQDAQAALDRVLAAERERIVSIYRELSTGSAVGAGDGHTFAVRYVDPKQFAAAIRKGGE